MREKVIIFDGENSQEIGAPYFFQDERIKDLTKIQVKNRYKSTFVYVKVLHDVQSKALNGPTKVELTSSEYLHKAERGLAILEQMVKDMWGDKEGNLIINQAKAIKS